MDFAVPANHRIKLKESEKRDKNLDLTGELKKKLRNMKVTVIPVVTGALGTGTDTETWELGNQRMGGDHPNYITENGQNTEKSPGDLKRLAVTQPRVEDHQQTFV